MFILIFYTFLAAWLGGVMSGVLFPGNKAVLLAPLALLREENTNNQEWITRLLFVVALLFPSLDEWKGRISCSLISIMTTKGISSAFIPHIQGSED